MLQAVALVALLAILWASPACAAGSPSEFLALSYGAASRFPPAGQEAAEGAGKYLPSRLEELLLAPVVAIPPPAVFTLPAAQLGQPVAYENLWDRIRSGFALPRLESPLVDRWQASYLSRAQNLKGIVERSRRYLFHVVEEIDKRGMPMELALLPMVESGYNPAALSSAQASGLWQFIPSTARDYKLPLTPDYDARRDIIASTSAALDYLQVLYELFGDWQLALAAYNWGEKSVAKAIEQNAARGLRTDFLSLTLPDETRNYVPKLHALKNMIGYPEIFKLELEYVANQPYFTTVTSNRDLDFEVAARLAGVSMEEFSSLNPAHARPQLSKDSPTGLVLPVGQAESFLANLRNYKGAELRQKGSKPAKSRRDSTRVHKKAAAPAKLGTP